MAPSTDTIEKTELQVAADATVAHEAELDAIYGPVEDYDEDAHRAEETLLAYVLADLLACAGIDFDPTVKLP